MQNVQSGGARGLELKTAVIDNTQKFFPGEYSTSYVFGSVVGQLATFLNNTQLFLHRLSCIFIQSTSQKGQ